MSVTEHSRQGHSVTVMGQNKNKSTCFYGILWSQVWLSTAKLKNQLSKSQNDQTFPSFSNMNDGCFLTNCNFIFILLTWDKKLLRYHRIVLISWQHLIQRKNMVLELSPKSWNISPQLYNAPHHGLYSLL